MAVSVGTLLATTQPAIMAPTGSLLGRNSLGSGGPEPVSVGTGLQLASETLTATGADHATFAVSAALTATDQAVINSSGTPKLLQLSLLRGLFFSGENISIDSSGTISAAGDVGNNGTATPYSITDLSSVSSIAASDLVGISQGGEDHSISYSSLINGQTIDEAAAASPAADTDTLWVGQGGSTTLRQTMSAVWVWIASKLPNYTQPILELTASATLAPGLHGGRILVCSQPIVLSPPLPSAGTGFQCEVINLSSGNVVFASGITTSSGSSTLLPGQAANLCSLTYSGGSITYASVAGAAAAVAPPGQVTGLSTTAITSNSVALTWAAPSPSASSYNVQYRITGTTSWTALAPVTASNCLVGALASGTSYDFAVSGVNAGGTGSPSAILSVSTSASLSAPGQATGLAGTNATSSSISLTWSAPSSGGSPSGYTVQYRVTGAQNWNTATSGLNTTSYAVTSLSAATSYDFQVFATNAAGAGSPSAVFATSTLASSTSITAVTWNVVPSGSYVHGSGAIGVNAHIAPATAPVQFGFSSSAITPPTNWTVASYVNTDLWGAYVPTPASAGAFYVWVEGTDGSMPTPYATPFTVT